MKNLTMFLSVFFLTTILFSSCTTWNKTMKEPNVRVELQKNDFTLSDQVNAEATSKTIVGIDFDRLFNQKTGNIENNSTSISIASIPVVGTLLDDKTSNYALYELMDKNKGYDVVFYPQYNVKVEKPILGIGFLTKITTVTVTARLGKLKK